LPFYVKEEAIKARLNPKVIDVYTQIGEILSRYTSGPLPKAFKIIPGLSNWEEILYLTKPESWSPPAVRMATKIFASNLNTKLAQKYYNTVLLQRIREDVARNKKLNWHLYMALKKALFKPSAFYKGILLPICMSGDATLKEATIISSLLKKVSIPQVQSSVALMKIAQMPYSGANSIFIRVLIDKKYALPLDVVDALVQHFLSFKGDSRTLPVLWHHSLLSFAQVYKKDITEQQKQALKALMKVKTHPLITPEIRRELFSTTSREGAMAVDGAADEDEYMQE
jgi:essential nuclear protein 1